MNFAAHQVLNYLPRCSSQAAFRSFSRCAAVNMPIKAGDSLPSVEVFDGAPDKKVNLADLFKGKKGILLGVPGAFTGGCTNTHLPSYIDNYDALKAKGIQEIVCISVNDIFVTNAWAKELQTEGKIRMLSDTMSEFTKAIDLELDLAPLLPQRSQRYSLVIEDGVVKEAHIEPDGKGLTCSLGGNVIKSL
jgi:2-Cys peroxiredoxin 5